MENPNYLVNPPMYRAKSEEFTAIPIRPGTWYIWGKGDHSYLLTGETGAMMIDTGESTENIRAFVQTLTDKPVTFCANTHGHFDHTGGNGWFDYAYMSAEAVKTAKTPHSYNAEAVYPFDYEIRIIGDGDVIRDLEGRPLEAIAIPCHSDSSLAYLDSAERILFVGDEVADDVIVRNLPQFYKNLQRLLARRAEYDWVCAGSGYIIYPADLIDAQAENARRCLAGIEGCEVGFRWGQPKGFRIRDAEFKRRSAYGGYSLIYDIRDVPERG